MINSAQQYPVHVLLNNEDKVQYRVPKYQREYSWQRPQWEDLFEDLVEADGSHFLGTIITLNQTKDASSKIVLELIDGQQRMTTLTILLAAVYSCLAEDSNPDDETTLNRLNLRHRLVRKNDQELRVIPQVQGHNLADYSTALNRAGLTDIKADVRPYYPSRRISKCYQYFRDAIESLAETEEVALAVAANRILESVLQAVMVKIEVASHADAFVLFESLNNRGMALTPVDLIKNHLLAESERRSVMSVDEAFDRWNAMLANLGDDYAMHERFLRHYYNAFRGELPLVENAPVATKARLIRIYERLLADDFTGVIERLVGASELYGRIACVRGADRSTSLDVALNRLMRAQGVPSYVLILWLMVHAEELRIDETHLNRVIGHLTSFFVRRNLSGLPATYTLPKLFMTVIESLNGLAADGVVGEIRRRLVEVSVSDETFREALRGPIYNVNSDVARFVLTALEEERMTSESQRDLWEWERGHFVWTIEHIFPQGANLPEGWVEMMGGSEAATAAQESDVHRLGNLTITRYNSTLSNRTFSEKRDREDQKGRAIGYRNGLWLNADLRDRDGWVLADIHERTERLAVEVLNLFS
ncbi:DUF262 domain-containing protein [Microbacterium hominis]|uniref:DUF262 domain-containing protein n=1 Tax=Microbacterium hominis TaxID=162426 RepID=A0A7D4TFF6_9MICO|nr:DUF262 domain-containing protein [Microbacterium hominis]QKJ18581.1 DUF262 domain-containing protein [Microbacterium hominis]